MAYSTWLEDACHETCQRLEQEPLDAIATLVGEAGHRTENHGPVIWRDEELPSHEDVAGVRVDPKDPSKPSDFFKWAQATLPKAHRLYKPIFDPSKPLAAGVGDRYRTGRSAAAWASGYLTGADGVEPIHIFALFADQILQWGEDDDGVAFVEKFWIHVQHFWSIDSARVKQEALDKQVAARDAQDIIQGMIAGVAKWHPDILTMDFIDARRWIMRRLIVSLSGSTLYYIMNPDGEYSPNGVNSQQLVPALIVQAGKIVKLKNEEGKYRDSRDLLNHYSTSIYALRYEAGTIHSRIENPMTQHATLVFGVYTRRTDLVPEWSDDVEAWLRAFAGSRYDVLCEWIGHAIAFDEGALPILSIVGPPDCGKKLLVQGLAETLIDPTTFDAQAIFGTWNDPLTRSPFGWLDEGWALASAKHPADRIREIIGAPEIRLERRFRDTATLRANLRLVITSNSMETIARLGLGKDLNEDSQQAILERVIHINVPADAPRFLKDRGGMQFTRGWIRPDKVGAAAEASRFVIAKHFLKLYEMTKDRRDKQTGRYLMSGLSAEAYDASVRAELRSASASSGMVATAVFRFLNYATAVKPGATHDQSLSRIWIDKDRKEIYVLAGGIIDYVKRDEFFGPRDVPSLKQFTKGLDNLTKPIEITRGNSSLVSSCSGDRYLLQSRKEIGAQKWKRLDVDLLLSIARNAQYPVEILERFAGDGAQVLSMPPPAPPEEVMEATA